tara:strand:- start:1015 stop:2160 length:1146 start_codon:yes stop_codon:yes gene_type:complete
MSTAVEVAAALGRRVRDAPHFARPVDVPEYGAEHAALVVDLLCVAGALGSAHGGDALCEYVANEVWPSETRSAFFLQAPLDQLVFKFANGTLGACDARAFDLFGCAAVAGARVDRLACGTVPALVKLAATTEHVDALCALAEAYAHDAEARPLVLDPDLFRALAARMRSRAHTPAVVRLIFATDALHDVRVFDAVVERCATLLVVEFLRVHDLAHEAGLRAALDLLERVAVHGAWRARLLPHVSSLARHSWPVEFGTLLATLLSTTSVELVLRLHEHRKLDSLLEAVRRHAPASLEWRVVRGCLRRHWPALCDACAAPPKADAGAAAPCCPITLEPCARPVVASDGHVYERDALMRHMSVNGAISPMTREVLEYHLYELRV